MTEVRQGPAKQIKALIRRRIGLWRLYEYRNAIRFAVPSVRVRRVEDAEVNRLRTSQSKVPTALVATIMPSYKRPELLLRAVGSALNQTITDHVVVIVDDGGGLPALPDDPRLHVLELSTNTGVLGSVRNVGIRLSQSRYIAFLDDDNEWAPHHLQTALDALENGFDLVYTAVQRRRADGTLIHVLSEPFDRHKLADDSYVDANSVVVRRDPKVLFNRMPRVRSTLPKEDWEFVFRLSRTRRVLHVPESTVRYLVNEASFYTSWASPEELRDD